MCSRLLEVVFEGLESRYPDCKAPPTLVLEDCARICSSWNGLLLNKEDMVEKPAFFRMLDDLRAFLQLCQLRLSKSIVSILPENEQLKPTIPKGARILLVALRDLFDGAEVTLRKQLAFVRAANSFCTFAVHVGEETFDGDEEAALRQKGALYSTDALLAFTELDAKETRQLKDVLYGTIADD
jgi:hypothetical protein